MKMNNKKTAAIRRFGLNEIT